MCEEERYDQTDGDGPIRPGDLVRFNNGIPFNYNVGENVGIFATAAVRGNIQIAKNGRVTVYAEVFSPQNLYSFDYIANARFTSNGTENFVSLDFHGENFMYDSNVTPLGFAYYDLPNTGTVTLDVYIGYSLSNGGYSNGDYYKGSFNLKW